MMSGAHAENIISVFFYFIIKFIFFFPRLFLFHFLCAMYETKKISWTLDDTFLTRRSILTVTCELGTQFKCPRPLDTKILSFYFVNNWVSRVPLNWIIWYNLGKINRRKKKCYCIIFWNGSVLLFCIQISLSKNVINWKWMPNKMD
jgi:hypothetical protein